MYRCGLEWYGGWRGLIHPWCCAFLGGLPLKRVLPLELITCENADQLVVFLCHPCAFGHVKISNSISAQKNLGLARVSHGWCWSKQSPANPRVRVACRRFWHISAWIHACWGTSTKYTPWWCLFQKKKLRNFSSSRPGLNKIINRVSVTPCNGNEGHHW